MILVAGATGMLGGEIALRLLQAGEEVRILVRQHSPAEAHFLQSSADALKMLIEAGALPVYGDLKDRASLDAACQGVKQLITTANSAARGGEDNPQTVDLQGNRDLIEAARQAGVGHFIFVSAQVPEPIRQHPFMAAKLETEAYLRASGLTYTILAPNGFMEATVIRTIGDQALAGDPVTLIGSGERVHSFIARRDVASFALAALEHQAAQDTRLALGGPQSYSLRDVVREYERILDRQLTIQTFQPGEQIPGLAENQLFLLTAYNAYQSPLDMSEICQTFAVELTPMGVALRDNLAYLE